MPQSRHWPETTIAGVAQPVIATDTGARVALLDTLVIHAEPVRRLAVECTEAP